MAQRMVNLKGLGFKAWFGPAMAMSVAHSHGDLELNFLPRGSIAYLIAGRVVRVPAGRLCLLWGAVPHRLIHVGRQRGSPATNMYWVTVPLEWLMQWRLAESLVKRLLQGRLVLDAADADGGDLDQRMLARWCEDLGRGEARRAVAALEVQARLRRMELRLVDSNRDVVASAAPRAAAYLDPRVEQMARLMAARYRQPLSVREIADSVGLHPNYAMTLFRRHAGQSLLAYLTQHRVADAQRLLATTDRPILSIALDCGFGSVSRFYEAFHRATGQSPRGYRRAMTGV